MKLGECIQVDPWLRFMGPIWSKVIEVKNQIYVVFFFSVGHVFFSVCSDLHQSWWEVEGGPIEYRGQRSNLCVFFLFVPPRSVGQSSPNLVGRLKAAPDISSRGSFLKVKVIKVKGQGQRSNFCISAVLGPICMKLGECIQVDPWLRFMCPIGSKVIEVKVQIYVCFFLLVMFFLFVPLLHPGPWADLHQTWWEGRGRPRILARVVHFLKGKGHRGQIYVFFSMFVPPRSLGRSSPNLILVKIYGSNWVKGHRGQRSNLCCFVLFVPPRSLGRSSPNLLGRFRAGLDISSRGSFFKGQGHRGQRSKFCISAVLGPICMKLGECIQVDLWLRFMGPIGSNVIEVKGTGKIY